MQIDDKIEIEILIKTINETITNAKKNAKNEKNEQNKKNNNFVKIIIHSNINIIY